MSGKETEEDFFVTLTSMPLPGGTVDWSGQACSFRAAKGQLEKIMPILRMMQASTLINLLWFNDVEQACTIMQEITANEMEQARIRSQIISHLQDHISAEIQETFLNRQKAMEHASDEWDGLLRDLQSRPDPIHPGHSYHVPIGFDHMFVSDDGSRVVVTNNPAFNPGSLGPGYHPIGDTQ